jgi:hypothetical protein
VEFEQVLATLALTEYAEQIRPEWEDSQAAMPQGEFAFLAPEFLREACRETGIPEAAEAAVRAAQRIAQNEALCALAWHFHCLLFQSRTAHWDTICRWPPPEALGEDAGRFYAVVLLSGFPIMQQAHRAHRIPDAIVRETLRDLRPWMVDLPAVRPINVAWLMNHLRGGLYRLGRLQFQFASMYYRIRVFRHRETRVVLALSEDGVAYRADGQIDRHGDAAGGWTARLTVDESSAIGYPLLPTGRAVQREVTLPAAEWEQALANGDPVINIHIPGGSALSHAACGDSFRQATAFLPEHYPDYHYRAFLCGSWILNTWLQEVLPSTSNLVRFQREVYLFPSGVWLPSMYDRVFGRAELPEDLSQLPRDTGLRRAIVEALESGHGPGTGGGAFFLFPEDFHWGAEVYRRQELPFGL